MLFRPLKTLDPDFLSGDRTLTAIKGDLAVMSIETYEELAGRFELYSKLQEGLDDVAAGRERPLNEVMADLRNRRNRR